MHKKIDRVRCLSGSFVIKTRSFDTRIKIIYSEALKTFIQSGFPGPYRLFSMILFRLMYIAGICKTSFVELSKTVDFADLVGKC